MFYRHKDFSETEVHQCADADKYNRRYRQEIANVRRHDITSYLLVPVRDKKQPMKDGDYPIADFEIVHIKFCPFCGCNLDEDESSPDFLKLPLMKKG